MRSSGNESSTDHEDHEDLSRTIRKSPRYAVKKSPTPQDAEDISNTNSLSQQCTLKVERIDNGNEHQNLRTSEPFTVNR